ncbi:MAG: beta galactosidase jelly roll domain-containing protein [Candidatus Marinimicrobia bacterium]|nr:beta galactosidase jelly roll domain-containing protein [Candidatus Neomarinimicrobiota bacterium]
MTTKARPQDLFAAIAAQGGEARRGLLIEPQPSALPDCFLPGEQSNPKAAFRPAAKLDTAAKLQHELKRQRRRLAPFLRNLAPAPASARLIVPVEAFDWRLETAADRQDSATVFNGEGEWQSVTIPHYGGPVGRAAAYYRTTFEVTEAMRARGTLWICFKGVDYKAQVFLNGAFLGAHEGFFAPFEFEMTAAARMGENVLVVKVENDAVPISDGRSWGMTVDGDKLYAATGPGWDDPELGWHHCPPGMGIYQAVTIEARPALHLADVFVRPLPEEQRCELWVEVFNSGRQPEAVALRVSLFGQNFKATLFRDRVYEPPQKAGPRLNCYRFALDLPQPRIWDLDTPWLYQAQVGLGNGDVMTRQFGMRSFRMDISEKPYGRYFLNGREIRLRGANTMGFEQQDVIRGDFDQLCDDILLAKICHMNFLRLTQRPVQPEIYELCDRLGLMTQTDLPLFGHLPRRQFCEAVRQAGEMERLVRCHPCNIVVSYINEPFPPAWGDKTHRQCNRAELERFFEAANQAVLLANPDRVIKPVDGDYDPPASGLPDNHCYTCWYNGHGVDIGKLHKGYWQRVKPDWFYGCGEFGAEGLDPVGVMRKYYPQAWLPQSPAEEATWSPDRIKNAQSGRFHYMFFDTPRTLADWVAASQRHQAWATRSMTEAFRRDNRMNTFAIHLFIDAFPAGWMKAIMDVERQPKPAFFAYREALTPLKADIRVDRWAYTAGEAMCFEFRVCNDTHEAPTGARLRYQLEVGGKVVFAQQARARIAPCQSVFQGFLKLDAPPVEQRTPAVLRLALADRAGQVLHDTAVELTFFPVAPSARAGRVGVIGARNGKAAGLARELGLQPVFPRTLHAGASPLILIDDPVRFQAQRVAVEAAVRAGATAVFLELPAGEHAIAGDRMVMETCGMGTRHFVSRATGHPLVAGFAPQDFWIWHDPADDCIAPFLETCFRAEGWTAILTTGSGGGTLSSPIAWSPALAAAEKREGAGRWVICQVALAGRTRTNPVAALFARRLTEG